MPSLLRGLLLTSLLGSGLGELPEGSLVLAEFPESMESLPWRVVNDSVMGGRSEGGIQLEERSLVFTGRTNTDGGGFSSIRSETRRFDLGAFDGIRLRVRGDGRRYTFRLTTGNTRDERRRPSYWADFETGGDGWQVIEVAFRRFRPRWRGRWLEGPELDTRAIDGLGLMIYDGRDGSFRLEVDWIRAYREGGTP